MTSETEHIEFFEKKVDILSVNFDFNWQKIYKKFSLKFKICCKILQLYYYKLILYFIQAWLEYCILFEKYINKKE
jgi:hypothetical protein